MGGFRISERFRLEVHWEMVTYEQDDIANLVSCCLSGPVIKEVESMNPMDSISLDFGNQYIIFVNNFYIAQLSWQGVKQTTDRIYLQNVTLTNRNVNSVPKLRDNDYIVIDTKDHEDAKHQHNLTYPSYLIRSDGNMYKFEDQ